MAKYKVKILMEYEEVVEADSENDAMMQAQTSMEENAAGGYAHDMIVDAIVEIVRQPSN